MIHSSSKIPKHPPGQDTDIAAHDTFFISDPQTSIYTSRDITNSISSLGKLSKNEIQQPNNYKKVFE